MREKSSEGAKEQAGGAVAAIGRLEVRLAEVRQTIAGQR